MGFDGARRVAGGESKAALLEKSKAGREARTRHRERWRAALAIQRIWRGHRCSKVFRASLEAEWDQKYGALLASGGAPQASELHESLLPPLLFLLLPAQRCHSRSLQGGWLGALRDADAARARGVVGALLGSLASSSPAHNYCSLAVAPSPSASACVAGRSGAEGGRWRCQSARLLRLCVKALHCSLRREDGARCDGAAPPSHGTQANRLLMVGAGRLIAKLTDAAQWKCFPAQSADQSADQSAVQSAASAARKLLRALVAEPSFMQCLHRCLNLAVGDEARSSSACSSSARSSSAGAAAVLPALLDVAFRAVTDHVDNNNMHSDGQATQIPDLIVKYLLTVDNLSDALPPPLLDKMRHPSVLRPCLRHLCTPAGRDAIAGGAAVVASNVLRLVLPPSLPAAELAEEPGGLKEYLAAVQSLCAQFAQPDSDPRAQAVLRALGSRRHMDWLLGPTTEDDQKHASVSGSAYIRAGEVAALYAAMVGAGGEARCGGANERATLLTSLAFHPTMLPRVWGFVAKALRVPTEVPEQVASHAGGPVWDMVQLKSGASGMPRHLSAVLALFCQVYAHLLLVLDDDDFYVKQAPFTLPQQRSIAATLNSMVYHTLANAPDACSRDGAAGAGAGEAGALVPAASGLLRSLYQRDYRRSFCHPSLWLAPAARESTVPATAAARAFAVFFGDASPLPNNNNNHNSTHQAASRGVGGLLREAPHMIPFEQRVRIFRALVEQEKTVHGWGRSSAEGGPRAVSITVRRGSEVEDAFSQLGAGSRVPGSQLKGPMMVSFVNQQGLAEAGVDQGGLLKEFLTEVVRSGVDPQFGLFESTSEGLLYSRPAAVKLEQGLELLELIGRMIGKALYDGVLIDVAFAPFFTNKILGQYSYLEDLPNLDPTLYKSLIDLKRYEGDAKDLCLDFTVCDEFFGQVVTRELRPGGAQIDVDDSNKMMYIHMVADWRLNGCMKRVANAFVGGLSEVLNPAWLCMFNPREVNMLLSGGDADIDIDDLAAHVRYSGGFHENSRAIKNLWSVLKEFTKEEKMSFLKFVTSCSRPPLLGFKHLNPAFTIHKVVCEASVFALFGGHDVDRLPTASTCYNMLKLPTYKRSSTLREKLKYAIVSGSGFELS